MTEPDPRGDSVQPRPTASHNVACTDGFITMAEAGRRAALEFVTKLTPDERRNVVFTLETYRLIAAVESGNLAATEIDQVQEAVACRQAIDAARPRTRARRRPP